MLARRTAVATFALALFLVPGSARATEQACSVEVTGAVKASFACTVSALTRGDGAVRVAILPGRLPKQVKVSIPGEFELPAPVQVGVYSLDRLASAKVFLTSSKHATFGAEKSKRQRQGDVTVKLTRVENVTPGHGGAPSLAGKLEARLVPLGEGAQGEVRVTVKF